MKSLLRLTHGKLRKLDKKTLLNHCESRMSTLLKRSIKEQNYRNEANDIDMRISFDKLNAETLAYLAAVLNKSERI